jgi:transcription initiation factor TFIIIB Brf1 subunit/transcription initiation factor TFIIB
MHHQSIYHQLLGVPFPTKEECICGDCKCNVDDRFGDPRVKIMTFDSIDAKQPTSVKLICKYCADEQFGDHSPNSIFE